MLFHPVIRSLWGSCDISLFFHEEKLSLTCITGPGTPWLTPPFSPLVPAGATEQNRSMLWTGLRQGSGKGERFKNQARGENWKGHIRGNRSEEVPCPQTSPPVWIEPSLPLKVFVSDWSSPQCSLSHVYPERLGETAGLLHRPWRFSKLQPSRRVIFLCFLSCFHCRELRGVPETERNQPQPCVPTECHLSRHGVLGVSGNILSPSAPGGLCPGAAQLTLPPPLEKAWPCLQPCTSWLLSAPGCFGSQNGDLERFPKGAAERNAFLFFDDMSACLFTYWDKKCLVKWWAV